METCKVELDGQVHTVRHIPFDHMVLIENKRRIVCQWEFGRGVEEEALAEPWYQYVCTALQHHGRIPAFIRSIEWPDHIPKIKQLLNEHRFSDDGRFVSNVARSLFHKGITPPDIALFLGISETDVLHFAGSR